jgi:predicted metal-dependent HD superfamily phosphohydrolase
MSTLKETFVELIACYKDDDQLTNELWNEIEGSYSNKKRHYHTLDHLDNLLRQLTEVKNDIKEWNTILFSLYYHDVVYNPLKSDNEERSADLAEKKMLQLSVPKLIIENCKAQILATKKHNINQDSDVNFFTDADLSILGSEWHVYSIYFKQVRKEYSIYPDLIYKPGRKKVLHHFLQMERIFKTDYFSSRFELQAKQNLQQELALL